MILVKIQIFTINYNMDNQGRAAQAAQDQDDLEAMIMNQALDANNQRIIDIMFGSRVSDEDIKKIQTFCHYNYSKKSAECGVCMENKLSHKCFQCTFWMCTTCFIKVNMNPESSDCPNCRFKYTIQALVDKTAENIAALKKKYGASELSNKVMESAVFQEEKTPEPRLRTNTFSAEYNYRCDRLEVRAESDSSQPVDFLKIKMDIQKYPVATQVNLLEFMNDIWHATIRRGNSRHWNSAANKINNMLRSKLSPAQLDEKLGTNV